MSAAKNRFLALVFTFLAVQSVQAEILPIEYFAQLPDFRQASLSPDGKKIAGIVTVRGTSMIIAMDLEAKKTYPLGRTENETAKINWIRWGNNERLLMSYRRPENQWGVEYMTSRLMSIKYDGTDMRGMFWEDSQYDYVPQYQDQIISMLPDDDRYFLLALDSQDPGSDGVYRVDINTGKRKLIQSSVTNARDWIADQQGRPRIAIATDGTDQKIVVFDTKGKNRRTLWEFETFSEDIIKPMGFGLDPNQLYVRAYHKGRLAIFDVDLSDPELNLNLIVASERRDITGGLIYSPKTGDAIGVNYATSESLYHFWDESYAKLSEAIDKALSNTNNWINGFSADESRYLIYSNDDTSPGMYYLGDRDRNQLQVVGRAYPHLTPDVLQPKKVKRIEARDGLKMTAYLTLPKDASDQPIPTVLHPHGGPIARDTSGFDYWTQFFANRGYAVLQVNFRGSSGYGFDFMEAGLQNWGQEMQEDLEDATRWLVEEGIADPERICIVGGSYGGYAALMGVAKTPDLYACAVSFAGVTDLNRLVKGARGYTSYEAVKEIVGTDKSQLRETSPARLAEAINAPILLAHGDKDIRVQVEHSRLMKSALQRADKDFEYIEFEDGDHHLSNAEHRMEFFKAMDTFLAKYLAPRADNRQASSSN